MSKSDERKDGDDAFNELFGKDMKVIDLGTFNLGGKRRTAGLPPGLGEALAGLMMAGPGGFPGMGADDVDEGHPLLKMIKSRAERQPFRPATAKEFRAFLEGAPKNKPRVGDICRVRPDALLHKWPTGEEQFIISQVLEQPVYHGAFNSWEAGVRHDVALMFCENTDPEIEAAFAEPGTEPRIPVLTEFLWDSRRLEILGNVFDDESKK